MAGEVEYDTRAMHAALTKLRQIQLGLEREEADLRNLERARPPGTAPATNPFHNKYLHWATSMREQHDAARNETWQAIKTLIAIDRQYNNGELANELNFDKIKPGED